MIDPRLTIAEETLAGVRDLYERGAQAEEMIWYLFHQGLSKPLATFALRRTKVMPSSKTKEAVHDHPAYAYRRESDEAFWEAAHEAVLQAERVDSAA